MLILGERSGPWGAGIPTGFVPQRGKEDKNRLSKECCDEEWAEILGWVLEEGIAFHEPLLPAPFLTAQLVSQK